jgi:hypothetical protein
VVTRLLTLESEREGLGAHDELWAKRCKSAECPPDPRVELWRAALVERLLDAQTRRTIEALGARQLRGAHVWRGPAADDSGARLL